MRYLFVFISILIFAAAVHAEEVAKAHEVSRAAIAKEILVTSVNVNAFEEVLLAPLHLWVTQEKMVLRVSPTIDGFWSYSDQWNDATTEFRTDFELKPDGSIVNLEEVWPEQG